MLRIRMLWVLLVVLIGFSSIASAATADWLVLLYFDADDEMLEQDMFGSWPVRLKERSLL